MPPDAFAAILLVLAVLTLLALTRIGADLVFAAALTLLLLGGLLTPEQALQGFSNPGLITIGALYVVVAGLRDTGGIEWIAERVLGRPRTLAGAQFKLMAPVMGMSAFLNNTPIVAMMMPVVTDWGRKLGFPASKLMIPLSYAAILGGTCTLIGTSTNLIVNGLLLRVTGGTGLGMFELAWIGVPSAVLGMVYLMTVGRRLLPVRGSAREEFENAREYTLEMIVERGGPLAGRSVEAAGLRHLPGMYLAEIERKGRVLAAVGPDEVLEDEDLLLFVGVVDAAVELQRMRGLAPAAEPVFELEGSRVGNSLVEAVVSDTNPLVGSSIRESRFRSHYDAVVIAVARQGARLRQKVGDIVLRPGDTLLLETRARFLQRHGKSRDFFLVSPVADSTPVRHDRALIALAILGLMIVVVSAGWLSMLEAAMGAAGMMLLMRCTTGAAARRSIDWSVLIVIGAGLGIGAALEVTGATDVIAAVLMGLAGSDLRLNLLAIYVLTVLTTALISNNAAAVLVFPIALRTADALGVDFMPFVIAVTMAASADFATPIGYQTNLMVYGPGGYRFSDYLRVGLPLNALVAGIAMLVIPWVWRF